MLVGCDEEIWFRLTDDFQWVVTNSNMGSKYITIVKLNVLGQEINNSLEIEDLKRTKIISKKKQVEWIISYNEEKYVNYERVQESVVSGKYRCKEK